MALVRSVLEVKGTEIWSISRDESVLDAIKLMSDKGIGALLVLDAQDLVGIISERDYTRKVILKGRSSRETQVGEIMTSEVMCVDVEQTIEECMGLMTAKHIRHLPVLENGRLIGIVSLGDLVKSIIAHQESTIRGLESYILFQSGAQQ